MRQNKKQKIVVAMSGGVDSSVAAALLKKAGFNVVGVFMKFWLARRSLGEGGAGYNRCCSSESEKRARSVAKKIGIPFYVFNFEKEFKKKIVDYFLKEYKAGRTPNPCVVCNKEIKFGLLLEKALALGADYAATGHYARKQKTENRKQKIEYKLLRARDKNKDQSYFLWMLNQKQLRHILFPIGDYTKNQVRNLAKKFKLPVSNVPESMEICFVKTTVNDFLTRYLRQNTGKIVDVKGKTIGQHQGLSFYTIGQRKGIGLPGGPYYVLNKDIKRNFLIVIKNPKDLYKKELIAKNVNWVAGQTPRLPLKVKAKIRYRHNQASATIYPLSTNRYKIIFNKPQKAITPGQSVVFYVSAEALAKADKNNELLGGGIINT